MAFTAGLAGYTSLCISFLFSLSSPQVVAHLQAWTILTGPVGYLEPIQISWDFGWVTTGYVVTYELCDAYGLQLGNKTTITDFSPSCPLVYSFPRLVNAGVHIFTVATINSSMYSAIQLANTDHVTLTAFPTQATASSSLTGFTDPTAITSTSSSHSGLSKGPIVAIAVVAGVLRLALLGGSSWFMYRRGQRSNKSGQESPGHVASTIEAQQQAGGKLAATGSPAS